MKGNLVVKRLLLSYTLLSVTACAQETLPPAASILDRYIEVTGGKAAWLAIRTEVRKATLERPSAGVKMAITAWRAAPNRSYLLLEAPGLGRVEEGTDGETVWGRSTMQGPRIKQGGERDGSLLAATLNSDLRWREFFPEAETRGVDDVDGQPCYRVELHTTGGLRQVRFYSKQTGLLVKNVLITKGPMGEITADSYLTDYRRVNGVLVAFKVSTKVLGMTTTLAIESLEFNQEIDPAVFAVPDDIRALAGKQAGKHDGP